jgi:predicted aldo/keto reductase-like oxidoreductase
MEIVDRINGIPTRPLGDTGVQVTIIGLGGYHIRLIRDDGEAIRVIRTAIDEGVNFMDNAWCYHDGESERLMGKALRDGYRDKVFLMTKNHGRDRASFRSQLEESLVRLQTDRIDLLQFHEINEETEPQRVFTEGAIDEATKARDEGKIRFIGFTGHKWPHILREMLAMDFQWDTLQMPTNLFDAHFRSFVSGVLPLAVKQGVGVIGMKSLALSNILRTGLTAAEAVGYALSLPISTLVIGIDSMAYLKEDLHIVRTWHSLSDSLRQNLLERARPWATDGTYELYKTEW